LGQGSEDDCRDATLRKLRLRKFSGFYYTPQDAIIAIAPVPGGPAPPVREKLDEPFPHRLYPIDSGFLVKWPYQGEDYDPRHFQIERGGWDHEHCEACNAVIRIDDECWYTEGDSTSILCGTCYDRMSKLHGT
jgi:hypothetical protein